MVATAAAFLDHAGEDAQYADRREEQAEEADAPGDGRADARLFEVFVQVVGPPVTPCVTSDGMNGNENRTWR